MPLTRRQTIELTEAILDRREQLLRELRTDTAERNEAIEAADTDRDVEELKELEAAALRLDRGTYGACAECGAEIEMERLFARPEVTRCIACQRRHEKTHAGRSGPSL